MMLEYDQAAANISFDKNTVDNVVPGVFFNDITDSLGQNGVEGKSSFIFPGKNIGHINLDV
ncbi:MAG: hypothetical protein A2202_09240 [Bdellovibrionales bacterium RIFOXYA1_FULL_36_14]|nr:MAG: hypothetical protein A2202_09240 [Bdellovibrionales bacterium RIFOXYA1_FULL_36_14]